MEIFKREERPSEGANVEEGSEEGDLAAAPSVEQGPVGSGGKYTPAAGTSGRSRAAPATKEKPKLYCPFPGCKRSFTSGLWRLKVHYRAPATSRGSGVERGHGTELKHCPRCGKPLHYTRLRDLCHCFFCPSDAGDLQAYAEDDTNSTDTRQQKPTKPDDRALPARKRQRRGFPVKEKAAASRKIVKELAVKPEKLQRPVLDERVPSASGEAYGMGLSGTPFDMASMVQHPGMPAHPHPAWPPGVHGGAGAQGSGSPVLPNMFSNVSSYQHRYGMGTHPSSSGRYYYGFDSQQSCHWYGTQLAGRHGEIGFPPQNPYRFPPRYPYDGFVDEPDFCHLSKRRRDSPSNCSGSSGDESPRQQAAPAQQSGASWYQRYRASHQAEFEAAAMYFSDGPRRQHPHSNRPQHGSDV
eukprot:CAMPEP_0117672742 /NCGR_PEP_ID=MMETSP0804-20121206/14079_1 /TAXON_ID=1074897 /ORGANISM="Tetraselmis astigmatica, Strain CCMP880" /LENGTH=409 /DNA_ID=CAMNT_0005481389 /DNA_START=270 /DNA_END=1499 /DNA_ORIENTATION=+